jgi:hypothetical protein
MRIPQAPWGLREDAVQTETDETGRLTAANREAWLAALVEALKATVSKVGELPPYRIACGFPSKRAAARDPTVGECWPASRSQDDTFEIFVSPALDDPFDVAHTVLHELLHAVVGPEHGHKGPFKRAMRRVGLIGRASSSMPGDELASLIRGHILPNLGPYPHARLDPSRIARQGTRLIKASCAQCEYTIRLARKWLRVAPPLCPNPRCEQRGKPLTVDTNAGSTPIDIEQFLEQFDA